MASDLVTQRYFLGKFGKEDNELTLTEINKSFVVFELDQDELTLVAMYSNTDVPKGDKWNFQEAKKTAPLEFKAFSRKKRKKKNPAELPGQQHLEGLE